MPRPRHLLSLVKPRIVGLLCLTGVSALVAAGGASAIQTVAFVLAGGLIAGGSATLNCWYDRDIDQYMARTADRPLPSGDLSPRAALTFALGLLGLGSAVGLAILPLVSVGYMWLGVLAYVGLYTVWLKRRSRLGVVLGGSAGSFPVLAGWTVVGPLEPVALAMAALVFVWTPAHAWALAEVYREEFAAVGVATVPAVTDRRGTARAIGLAAILTVGLAIGIVPLAGRLYAVALVIGAPCFGWAYLSYVRHRTKQTAVRAFFSSNAFLAALVVAWAAGGGGPTGSSASLLVAAGVGLLFGLVWWARPALDGIPAAPVISDHTTAWWDRLRGAGGRGTPTAGDGDE